MYSQQWASGHLQQTSESKNQEQVQIDFNDQIRLFADKIIREFVIKLRQFMVEALQQSASQSSDNQSYIQKHLQTNLQRKDINDPESWDLLNLVQIFRDLFDRVFKQYFVADSINKLVPLLMQIKEMRNRLAHEISLAKPLPARKLYLVAEAVQNFFENFVVALPDGWMSQFAQMRLNALVLLNQDEILKLSAIQQTQLFPQIQQLQAQTQMLSHHVQATTAPKVQADLQINPGQKSSPRNSGNSQNSQNSLNHLQVNCNPQQHQQYQHQQNTSVQQSNNLPTFDHYVQSTKDVGGQYRYNSDIESDSQRSQSQKEPDYSGAFSQSDAAMMGQQIEQDDEFIITKIV